MSTERVEGSAANSGDRDIVNLFESAGPLPPQRARTRDENYRRTLTPGLHDRRHCIGKALRADQTDSRFTREARMAVRQMSRDLFMRAIDHGHLAFHESFERWIAKSAGQREDMIDASFV